jgi:hypothetical protein
MSLSKVFGLTVFCVGIVLLLFAFSATQTIFESIVKGIAGYYTEHTMLVLVAGVAMLVCGGLLALRKNP